ncbi:PAS domain-containing sensor histidine kinase [Undibacterium fentianense]|uniref:histidine kinase n=1 Tax=Undibacterium fentianense TaxID=2828728 RepID=A0A941IF49_9BURK|nr:PAS domain-containing sensor histidine kinase [Undibacterium fentianense]MBR7800341.1 PAS domain-containing sensor histidine kinase [Undibacterium fentianense]
MNQTLTLKTNILHHILQHVSEALMVVSAPTLTILEINQRSCDILGRPRSELLGQNLTNIECALQDLFFWDDLSSNPPFDGQRIAESEWLGVDGIAIPIEKRVSAYHDDEGAYWIIQAEDLTSRRRMQQEQVNLAAQLQSSLEATAEGIVSIDRAGRIINLNRRFAKMWGLSDDLIVARDEGLLFQHILALLSEQQAFASVLANLQDNPEQESEDQLSLQDGRFFICVSKPEYLRDRLIGRVFSVRDITAIKQVEHKLVDALGAAERAVNEKTHMLDALHLSESKLRRLINSSLIGIFQGDMSGHLTLANDVLLKLLGIDQQAIIGNQVNWLTLTSSSYHAAHAAALNELQTTGQAAPFEAELSRPDGSKVPVMVSLAGLEGSQFEWVGFVLDLTEQKKADKVKSEFISVVSHELRTPLTSIRGALGLLEHGAAGNLSPKIQHLIQIAHRNSQRLGILVNDLLDMEKLVSGKMEFKSEVFNLQDLCLQAIEANASYAARLDVRYEYLETVSNSDVVGDPERVMQVFANLLSNAAKFSPRGETVQIRIRAFGQHWRIEVEDHGSGIPEEFRHRIFSKFAQADGSNTRQQGGTGLGLNIAKSFVEKMGGEIGFDSHAGKGSLFWFTLPIATNAPN